MNFFKFRKLKKEVIPLLIQGKIGILPTDTLYGLVGQALQRGSVERIYAVRQRNPKKPCIILISSIDDLQLFKIKINPLQEKVLQNVWPGQVSVILDCEQGEFDYLHRGTKTLAFRLPKENWLRRLLTITGPLVAPSANPEGESPAIDILQAKAYFGENVDFYFDFGCILAEPSTLMELGKGGEISVLRGAIAKMKTG